MQAGQAAISATPDGQGFGYGEHLLVWSWRRIVTGRAHCPVMAREFADVCGDDGQEVFLTLCAFLKALAFASRRPLALVVSRRLALTSDERQVLTLLAAAQVEDHALLQAHLRWLARPDRRQELRIATYALAAALRANSLLLARPEPDMPDTCHRLRVVT